MTMFKPKTAVDPQDYMNQIDEPRKSEIKKLHEFIMATLPKLDTGIYHNIIGYGKFNYKSKSGRAGEWFTIGLASQKDYISIYVCAVDENNKYLAEAHKEWFPKSSIGKSCIRFKKIDDVDFGNLKKILLLAENAGPMNMVK